MKGIADGRVEVRPVELHFFMRHLAHELGNPVASIRMSAEMLLGGFPPEMHQELFQIIMSEALRMESLIESAVYFSAIGSPNRQDLDIQALIDAAIRQEEVAIPVRVHSTLNDAPIRGDLGQMARLMAEIIGNAAQSGATAVDITLSDDDDFTVIQVVDDGEGIPEERRVTVFDPFYTSRDGRLGLGLTIAKRIAELHHGSLQIDGVSPSGTTVTLRLPQRS